MKLDNSRSHQCAGKLIQAELDADQQASLMHDHDTL
jgi:hypothetical protein